MTVHDLINITGRGFTVPVFAALKIAGDVLLLQWSSNIPELYILNCGSLVVQDPLRGLQELRGSQSLEIEFLLVIVDLLPLRLVILVGIRN